MSISGRLKVLAALLLFPWSALGQTPKDSPSPAKGFRVYVVESGSAADRAGLQVGDVLTHWSKKDPGSPPVPLTVFAISELDATLSPLFTLMLHGSRNGEAMEWSFPKGKDLDGMAFTPPLPPILASQVQRAQEAQTVQTWDAALKHLQTINEATGLWLLNQAAISLQTGLPGETGDTLAGLAESLAVDNPASLYQSIPALLAAGRTETARRLCERRLQTSPSPLVQAWLHERLAELADSRNDPQAALEHRKKVLELKTATAPGTLSTADAHNNLAIMQRTLGDLEAAEGHAAHALQILEALLPQSAEHAAVLNSLGAIAVSRGDLQGAESRFKAALGIEEALGPESPDVAQLLNNLGIVAYYRGDLEKTETFFARALSIDRRFNPDSTAVARSLNNLGAIAKTRGRLAAAERYLSDALTIRRRLAPDSLSLAGTLNNLGMVAFSRGDLDTAENLMQEALDIKLKLAPHGEDTGSSLTNMGMIASARYDLDRAEMFHRKALALEEKLAPGSLDVAGPYNNLGSIALDRGDLDAAIELFSRARAIHEDQAPGSLALALSFRNLSLVHRKLGQFQEAKNLAQAALDIESREAPDSLRFARSCNALGLIANHAGQWEEAAAHFNKALKIYRFLAPGSELHAEFAFNLAAVHDQQQQTAQAVSLLEEAVGALENQISRLGGSREQREVFSAGKQDYYFQLMRLQLKLGEEEKAFSTLERSRAQSLRQMLAERDLVFSADVPEELDARRRALAVQYDKALSRLESLSAADGEKFVHLEEELKSIRREFESIRAEIKAASPRLASLTYPEPLTLAEAQQTLPPGTLCLSFALGEEEALVFALGPEKNKFRVVNLPLRASHLSLKLRRLHGTLRESQPVDVQTADLYNLLLAPFSRELQEAESLVVVPNGPLHLLPWPLLLGGPLQELPVSTALSLSLFEDMGKACPRCGAAFEVFGDPRYLPEEALPDKATSPGQGVLARGHHLAPLPGTRQEAEVIRSLFPEVTRVHLGAEANERAVKAIPDNTATLHLAVHGLVDPQRPLDSALALSVPGKEDNTQNGFLQVWEIFEQMRLPALDLVVLSACDTGLGQDLGGEGIVGLGRAFQYAGARSVMVSLWPISDESTSLLMERFYLHLRDGKNKARALREAQLDLAQGRIQGPNGKDLPHNFRHPFHWAGFTLVGAPD